MAVVPIAVNGRMRLVNIPGGATAEDAADAAAEEARRFEIDRRRQFVNGEQYDKENWDRAEACKIKDSERLPEHERKHAYSSQLAEAVAFIADQLAHGFDVELADQKADQVAQASYKATDRLTSGDDEHLVCRDLLHDALVAGDVAYEVRWDPVRQVVFYDYWESEHVQFDVDGGRLRRVIRDDLVWVENDDGDKQQVHERVVYEVVPNEIGVLECQRLVYYQDQEDPVEPPTWLGVPFIPWGLLRGMTKGLRTVRGESAITEVALDSALRYDAVEQLSYKIARYNSHGNLGVVGDAATLKVNRDGGVQKDVADVIRFPGGTQLVPITLPTDPQMIEHQRNELAEGIYRTFGLTRVEPSTIQGLGGVSGYALEILNRKSEGTFSRVREQWQKDWRTMTNMALNVYVYASEAIFVALGEDGETYDIDTEFGLPDGVVVAQRFDDVDPATTFPNRDIEIRMGSGYIVDDVSIRDDFTAGLISRAEALRERGKTDDEIKAIVGEIKDEKPTEGGVSQETRDTLATIGVGQSVVRAVERPAEA